MAIYKAVPKSSHAGVQVATGTVIKTLLQVATPSTTDLVVVAWGVSFAATSGTPGRIDLIDVDVAATVTSVTPEKWSAPDGPAALCVGGTSATGYNGTAEGSITDSRLLASENVSPQSGYSIWYPKLPRVKPSRFLRIRALFAADVNCVPWILFEEGT